MRDLAGHALKFTALYRHHYNLVWHAAWRLGANDDNVDDLVQETFLVALRRLPDFEFRGTKPTSTWLLKTLRHVMRNHQRGHIRRIRRQREYSALTQRQHEDSSITASHLAKRQVADFLQSLDPGRREVFILAEFGGYDCREIGKTLSIKPGTVRSRLHAARALFDARS